jgi:hypothetical protein
MKGYRCRHPLTFESQACMGTITMSAAIPPPSAQKGDGIDVLEKNVRVTALCSVR